MLPFLIRWSCVILFEIKKTWSLVSFFHNCYEAEFETMFEPYNDEITHYYRWALQLLHLKPIPRYCSRTQRAAQYILIQCYLSMQLSVSWLSFMSSKLNIHTFIINAMEWRIFHKLSLLIPGLRQHAHFKTTDTFSADYF